jgi:hypothetical protein
VEDEVFVRASPKWVMTGFAVVGYVARPAEGIGGGCMALYQRKPQGAEMAKERWHGDADFCFGALLVYRQARSRSGRFWS